MRIGQSKVGQVGQLGFLVTDLEAAAMHWVRTHGIGPFFIAENVVHEEFTYLGRPTEAKLSLALTYMGPFHLELCMQLNEAPSVYTRMRREGRLGLAHMAVYCDDLNEAASRFAPAEVIQYNRTPSGIETIYLDTEYDGGGTIEFIKSLGVHAERRELTRRTCEKWDGSRPLRPLSASNPLSSFDP